MEIHPLEKENERLRAENRKLRNLLKQYGIFVPEEGKKLSSAEKISIYRDYFKGRDDLYNKYYWNEKKKGFSWALDCAHFWKDGCLIKKGSKIPNRCFHCPVSSFKPLTDETVRHLFIGDDHEDFYGIGIFPLLKDNTCCFLALDFDDDHWLEQMAAVARTAVSCGFYPLMERSQSGEGGHLWFFFAENMRAADVRKMGEALLEETMKRESSLSFDSFDRMFPNQDTVPQDGAGNCIALPLRADAYRRGNAAFINYLGQVIRQPIEYLASRPKITREELQAFLDSHYHDDYFFDGDQMRMDLNTQTAFSPEISGYIDGRIIIRKKDLNSLTVNMLHRSASMWNPEYYAKIRRREEIYARTTPRVLSFFEEDDKYLYLPSGILEKLQALLPETNIQLEDRRSQGTDIPIEFRGKLRPDQEEAVQTMIRHHNGVLQAFPAFGKTVCGIWLTAHFHVSTLIIVDKNDLQDQWIERLDTFLTYPAPAKKRDKFIRKYNAASKKLGGKIDVATIGSLVKKENLHEILAQYGLVLIDECHHVPAAQYRIVLAACPASHIYGLTATPKRNDGLEKVIYMYCGPVRYRVTQSQARSGYAFRQVLVPRYTASRLLDADSSYQEMLAALMNDEARNYLIYRDIVKEYRNSGKIIVLSERIDHLEHLAGMLAKSCEDVYLLTGNVKKSEREKIIEHVRSLPSDSSYILLATSTLLGEGFDLPSLDILFLVLPIRAETRIEQYTGRIHRNDEGKDMVKVYDYADMGIPMAAAMYRTRLKQYLKEGYLVEESKREIKINRYFFEDDKGLDVLQKDIQQAEKEIVCFSDAPSMSFLQEHYQFLQEPVHKGVKVFAVLNKEGAYSTYLSAMGVSLIYSAHNRHFLVIDRRIVWIADHELLSDNKQGYCTREENMEMAEELIDSISTKKPEPPLEGLFAKGEKDE